MKSLGLMMDQTVSVRSWLRGALSMKAFRSGAALVNIFGGWCSLGLEQGLSVAEAEGKEARAIRVDI